ncbi:MAG: DUF456 domain-containing protein, partial [Treponemataceae bacterium]|nr:DUF456 domain-containing protein [Treponemataceae bacterium]
GAVAKFLLYIYTFCMNEFLSSLLASLPDMLLIGGAGLLLFVGFLGTFVPVIPGAPLAWAGLLLAFFSKFCEISVTTLIICAVAAVLVSILDNIFPVLSTKKSGGSKAGTIGSTIGLIVGLFIGPWGIIIGPFAGAFIGELIHDSRNTSQALKAAWGAFCGFLMGTGVKMATVIVFIIIFFKSF